MTDNTETHSFQILQTAFLMYIIYELSNDRYWIYATCLCLTLWLFSFLILVKKKKTKNANNKKNR